MSTTFRITPEGGWAVRMINKTGAPSVKGTLVMVSDAVDGAFKVCGAEGYDPIGVVYDDGKADGIYTYVVICGRAEVLMEDQHAPVRGNFVNTSTTGAGRAVTSAVPDGQSFAAVNNHFREIGHCMESKNAGTDVLALCMIHFN